MVDFLGGRSIIWFPLPAVLHELPMRIADPGLRGPSWPYVSEKFQYNRCVVV